MRFNAAGISETDMLIPESALPGWSMKPSVVSTKPVAMKIAPLKRAPVANPSFSPAIKMPLYIASVVSSVSDVVFSRMQSASIEKVKT